MRNIKINNQDFDTLILYAFRYSLGRMSNAPSTMSRVLINCFPELKESTRVLIIEEINNALEYHNAGIPCDEKTWKECLEKLERIKFGIYYNAKLLGFKE
jgi:hypothetical protein